MLSELPAGSRPEAPRIGTLPLYPDFILDILRVRVQVDFHIGRIAMLVSRSWQPFRHDAVPDARRNSRRPWQGQREQLSAAESTLRKYAVVRN